MDIEERQRAIALILAQSQKLRRNAVRLKKHGMKLAEEVALDAAALESLVAWMRGREFVRRTPTIDTSE